MKLLLDENLSRRIVPLLQTAYPGTSQIALLKLETASDREIWEFAKSNDFVIVTRDSDFHELSTLYGAPPSVVWLKTGNQSRISVLGYLLDHAEEINSALQQNNKSCIEIYS
jgi:predicted nuclease of predicted toxin-antitoxin system